MTSTTLRGLNLTNTPLLANQTFFGGYEYTGALLSGVVNCYASTNTRIVIIQNPNNFDTTYDVIISQTDIAPYTIQNINFILTLPYTKLVVTNLDAINQLQLDIIPVYTNLTYDVTVPTVVTGTVDIGNTVDVNVINSTLDISGSVVVTSQPHLSYLTDNVAVATMPAITGTVAVSSQPHLSYLTDNIAVATMPAITGTVAVSSQPHLSYLTDNIAVATQPALAFSTDKVDVTGSSIAVTSLPTTLSFRTTTAGNTGLVIKASAGIVARMYLSNYDTTNNAFMYVRLYDKATAATSADTPLCCFDIPHRGNTASARIMLDLDNLAFTNGLSIRATTGSNADNDVVVTGLASDISIFYK
jgi:hypothetical protein